MKPTWIYILPLLFVLSSCERLIEYKGEVTEPKLVLQAELGEGDTIVKAFVSRSRFFLDDQYGADYRLTDASVEMQRGEQAWQKMEVYTIKEKDWIKERYYAIHLDSALQAGETIRVRASHPKYDTITAEQTLVHRPWCQALDYNGQPQTLLRNNDLHSVELSLILQNYPFEDAILGVSVQCAYRMTFVYRSRKNSMKGTTTFLQSYDPLFAGLYGVSASGQMAFSSRYELFMGHDYVNGYHLNLEIPFSTYSSDAEILDFTIDSLAVSFNAHSNDSYLYRRSMYLSNKDYNGGDLDLGAEMSDMFGSEEDVQVYSNIANGYGIFAACSRYKIVKYNIKTVTQ